jgi:RHS repeat-associated protein
VAGNPLRLWDSRNHIVRFKYDRLQRPTHVLVRGGDDYPEDTLVEEMVYGESAPNAAAHNLRGQVWRQYDGAGLVTNHEVDFKGNLLESSRRLLEGYHQPVNWNAQPRLSEADFFSTSTTYDALNRPVRMTAPDESVIQPGYNEANLLERMDIWLRGSAEKFEADAQGWRDPTTADQHLVVNIDYDAKGQRTRINYGNGVVTEYTYDEETFRLIRLHTVRVLNAPPLLQDMHYTYDPVGNITRIRDDAQPVIVHAGEKVEPLATYTYDAMYRLTEATGREHISQQGTGQPDHQDIPRVSSAHPHQPEAMRNYTETYEYDAVGNFVAMFHRARRGTWTRNYTTAEHSNRLLKTTLPEGRWGHYSYDTHGNMTAMPHLPTMQWDFEDQLMASAQQAREDGTPETTYYVYYAGGQRVRKVTERSAKAGETPTRLKERIYLGGFEIYREYKADGQTITLERETLHGMDDQQRIALIETQTKKILDNGTVLGPQNAVVRYQLNNHLGSSCVEVNKAAEIISYEEYHPYGTTAYHAVSSEIEVSLKRYRYTGKERDQESGLYYYGARYYAAWLGRWIKIDPAGLKDGLNLYEHVQNNATNRVDPSGQQSELTIFHRTTPEDAASMSKSGASTTRSRPHVWAGEGFYGSSSPDIPSSTSARGNTIVAQTVSTQNMTTITDEGFIAMQQDTPKGKELRSLVRAQMWDAASDEFRRKGRVPSDRDVDIKMRDYMSSQMNKLAPDADVVRWKNPDGTYTYVVRNKTAFRGKAKVVGHILGGQFTKRIRQKLDRLAGAKKMSVKGRGGYATIGFMGFIAIATSAGIFITSEDRLDAAVSLVEGAASDAALGALFFKLTRNTGLAGVLTTVVGMESCDPSHNQWKAKYRMINDFIYKNFPGVNSKYQYCDALLGIFCGEWRYEVKEPNKYREIYSKIEFLVENPHILE